MRHLALWCSLVCLTACSRDGLNHGSDEPKHPTETDEDSPTDQDDVPQCGNGVKDPGEHCDPAITSGAGACPTSCVPVDPCLIVALVGEGCLVRCESTGSISTAIDGDGCCPRDLTAADDDDCEAEPSCGDGVRDAGESCDTGIAAGETYACPASCDTVTSCSTATLVGTECTARCEVTVSAPANGDGCCLGPAYAGLDDDCPAPVDCVEPAASFTAKEAWRWDDASLTLKLTSSTAAAPLVGQLTDDNGDGDVDADDVPDILVVLYGVAGGAGGGAGLGSLALLSGADGATHWVKSDYSVAPFATPALGDIDGDGKLEIVFIEAKADDPTKVVDLVALENTGAFKWRSEAITGATINDAFGALSITDLDGDGRSEILLGNRVFNAAGQLRWQGPDLEGAPEAMGRHAVAADLGGPPGLEVIDGNTVYDHDGNQLWSYDGVGYAFPTLADCNGDGTPEILFTGGPMDISAPTVALVDGDGHVLQGPVLLPIAGRPNSPGASGDLDGDGAPEFVFGATTTLVAIDCSLEVTMTATVVDLSGASGPVLFDFDGDGASEVVYVDEISARVIDHTGAQLWSASRPSLTGLETAAVADVDGDGEAEIVIPQARLVTGPPLPAGVIVYESNGTPWRGAPELWNQHPYQPGSIFDDGGIAVYPGPEWHWFNGMRAQRSLPHAGACP